MINWIYKCVGMLWPHEAEFSKPLHDQGDQLLAIFLPEVGPLCATQGALALRLSKLPMYERGKSLSGVVKHALELFIRFRHEDPKRWLPSLGRGQRLKPQGIFANARSTNQGRRAGARALCLFCLFVLSFSSSSPSSGVAVGQREKEKRREREDKGGT